MLHLIHFNSNSDIVVVVGDKTHYHLNFGVYDANIPTINGFVWHHCMVEENTYFLSNYIFEGINLFGDKKFI